MKKISKLLALLLVAAMMFSVLAACAKDETTDPGTTTNQPSNNPSTDAPSTDAPADDKPEVDFSSGEQDITEAEVTDDFVRKTAEGTLTIGVNTAIDGFDVAGGSQSPAMMSVYDALLAIDPQTREIVGRLAESWEWSEDYLTCTFHLRDANFSDGTPITSEDVANSIYAYATTPGMSQSYYTAIDLENCETPDENTYVMKLNKVYAQMEYTLCTTYIFSKAFAETATSEDWWNHPVSSGAYTVVENVDGSHTKLAGREDYWDGAPECMDVTFKLFSDSTAEFIAYQSGDIDIAMNILTDDAERIQRGDEKNTTLVITTAYDFKMLALCDYTECFQNENVRKAFAYAIDKEACCEAVYGILATPQRSNMNDSASYFTPVGSYPYDPEYARELLAGEGYNDGDIVLTMVIFNTTVDQLMAEAIQGYLQEIGVVMNIEAYPMPVAIPKFMAGELDIGLTGTGGGAYDAAQLFDKMDDGGTDPSTMIHDDELQALIDLGSGTMDPEVRAQAYADAQQLIYDKCYAVPIANINNAYCYRSYIDECYALTGEKINPFYVSWAD